MPFDDLETEKQAARLLLISPHTLRRARVTKKLFGMEAPSFVRLGRGKRPRIRYERSEIDRFARAVLGAQSPKDVRMSSDKGQ